MISKAFRLTKEQFTALLSQRDVKSVYNKLGTLKYTHENKGFSVVISGKHQKSAVLRNRIRRRIYTLFRNNPLPIGGILYLSKEAHSFDHETTKPLFQELLAKTTK